MIEKKDMHELVAAALACDDAGPLALVYASSPQRVWWLEVFSELTEANRSTLIRMAEVTWREQQMAAALNLRNGIRQSKARS